MFCQQIARQDSMYTYTKQMDMSGKTSYWKKSFRRRHFRKSWRRVLRRLQKTRVYGRYRRGALYFIPDTSSRAAATGKARSLTVDNRVRRTISNDDNAKRMRLTSSFKVRRPEELSRQRATMALFRLPQRREFLYVRRQMRKISFNGITIGDTSIST